MKLRIFDGCSPQVSGFSTDMRDVMEPKCLFESSRDPVEALGSDCKRQLRKSVYRSPLQLFIDELEDEVHFKSVEFESAKEHLKSLEKKFTNPNLNIDKTKSQCGQCHMRLGHTKRNCELGVCDGPQMCNDLDKHDVEKKQFYDASTTVKNITKDLEKIWTRLPGVLVKFWRSIKKIITYQKETPKNPIQKFMEERGVEFPKFKTHQTTTTTTTSSTETSASAPPVQYMPTYGYYPMGPMPMPFQFNASPLMMNQRRMPVGSPLPMFAIRRSPLVLGVLGWTQ
ncbi:unnamed protein product [Mytilus edulis]|uniref:Uncharacterized protein n=1 Tax=Mytilus edulis TaxID=6550 RepID=A0A8S3VB92_MYTED|nr:unnamed protein product [Mytilus edulis]